MESKLKQGEALFAEGRIREAEICFLELLKSDETTNLDACNNLGVIAYQREKHHEAFDYFSRALEIDPYHRDSVINMAFLLRSMNQYHESIPYLEKLKKKFPEDPEILELLHDALLSAEPKKKICFLCQQGFQSFLGDIVGYLGARCDVHPCYSDNDEEIRSSIRWADIVWLEWANQMTIEVTQKVPEIAHKKVICRLHGYEVFSQMPARINWDVVDHLIFVAKHKQEIFNQKFNVKSPPQSLIRNGVNTDQFTPAGNKQNTKRLVFLGHLNFRKGLPLLLQFYHELLKRDQDYFLYIRGDFQEPRLEMAARTMIHELSLADKVEFVSWVDDLNGWFQDKSHILSFSIEESFHYSIGNGMAAGLKPVIHAWNESRDIWPEEFIFRDLSEFLEQMTDQEYEPLRYRRLLFDNQLTLDTQLEKIMGLIKAIGTNSSHSTDPSTSPSEIEYTPGRTPAFPLKAEPVQSAQTITGIPGTEGVTAVQGESATSKEVLDSLEQRYSQDNPLGLLLKEKESIRDYVNLPYDLKHHPQDYDEARLVDLLQTTFHHIITSYFNSLSISKFDIETALTLLDLLESQWGRAHPLKPQPQTKESVIWHLYDFLSHFLKRTDEEKTVRLKPLDDVLTGAKATPLVKHILHNLKGWFEPLYRDQCLSSFIVHGSVSTLDFTSFSDLDTQIFLTEKAFASEQTIKQTAGLISGANILLKSFDPLQHHGYFVSTDLDRIAYPEAYLPLATMKHGLALLGSLEQRFALRSSEYENRFALWHMGYYFRKTYLKGSLPGTSFALKRFLSRLFMLPVLYLEAFENIFPYKRDAFQLARQYFAPSTWEVVETATRAREKWNPSKLLNLPVSFYRNVFAFSEPMMDRLRESSNE